ncbi:MAG: YggT family protein [Thermoleophilaceae bacterium]|nr:YggT family protein [Thermoleophilaceae bacterium]
MSAVLAAIDRVGIARFVDTLFLVYMVLVFIRVLMSWFTRIPYNRILNAVLEFVRETTDPYLNLFRRFIPMLRIGPGALDLSPIVAIIVLMIVRTIVVNLILG